ncbi:hypothetical protein [Saccharopolyspora pogona]|uniref:hypothetical protein n=1 Tax=Saccharopolyspora pogona TaxID=333966 RepID=UPI001684D558|nr:hypothetical protein [Saccharopolyspora pogona]
MAGYADAVRSDQAQSTECYSEATAVAAHIVDSQQRQHVEDYALAHQISSAFKLGDSATALDRGSQVRVEALPSTERKGRFLVDLAMAWKQHGRNDQAYRALAIAEQYAPGEVHTRSAARRLISSLAASPRHTAMPDIIGLARRAHVTV